MSSRLHIAFQSALGKKPTLTQKEVLVKLVFERVQRKIDILLEQGK
ncbi:hypothetical protein GW830_04465 [bacterium]|nr:hypothetical protein [bacterium]